MVRLVIEIGDSVKLRSGGAVMTVEELKGDTVVCIWHDKMARLQRAIFSVDILKSVGLNATEAWDESYHADEEDLAANRRNVGLN